MRNYLLRKWRAQLRHKTQNFQVLSYKKQSNNLTIQDTGRTNLLQVKFRVKCISFYNNLKQAKYKYVVNKVCKEFSISKITFYRWLSKYSRYGVVGLVPRSRRPKKIRRYVSLPLLQAIILIRMRTNWGAERIEQEMKKAGFRAPSHQTIHKIIRRYGVAVAYNRDKKSGCRYQRNEPNELWHFDVKGPIYLKGIGKIYLWGLLDDYSRYFLGYQIGFQRTMENSLLLLENSIKIYGTPKEIMTDNGTEFVGINNQSTKFTKYLEKLYINHLRTRICTPETNGKIEVFWQTIFRECFQVYYIETMEYLHKVIIKFTEEYNFHRLHSALSYKTPAEVFFNTKFSNNSFKNISALSDISDYLCSLLNLVDYKSTASKENLLSYVC